jgi:hypothetical protein
LKERGSRLGISLSVLAALAVFTAVELPHAISLNAFFAYSNPGYVFGPRLPSIVLSWLGPFLTALLAWIVLGEAARRFFSPAKSGLAKKIVLLLAAILVAAASVAMIIHPSKLIFR